MAMPYLKVSLPAEARCRVCRSVSISPSHNDCFFWDHFFAGKSYVAFLSGAINVRNSPIFQDVWDFPLRDLNASSSVFSGIAMLSFRIFWDSCGEACIFSLLKSMIFVSHSTQLKRG